MSCAIDRASMYGSLGLAKCCASSILLRRCAMTLTYAGSTTLTVANAAHGHAADNVVLMVPGSLVSEPLKTNNGTLLASVALDFVAVYDDTTGALVVRKTGLSTNGSGVFTVTDPALVAGVTYRVDWQTAGGQRRMPRKAAA